MNKLANGKENRQEQLSNAVELKSTFDGWGGTKRQTYQFKDSGHVVSAHSCLLPKFSITLRVGELRKLLENLEDEDHLTVTVSDQRVTTFRFVR